MTLDQTIYRMAVKRAEGGGIDISVDVGLKDGTFVTGLLYGQWLTGADGKVGKGSMSFDFGKITEITLKQWAEAGQDVATVCGSTSGDTGSMTLVIDNVSSPTTASFEFSADHNDPELAGQKMALTKYATEQLMTLSMKSHYAGSSDEDPFEPSNELLEDVMFKMVVKQGEGDNFRFVVNVEATGGDRIVRDGNFFKLKESVKLKICARWQADKGQMVEGYIGFTSPSAFKAKMDEAVAASPDDETLDAYRPESEAAYCPTLTEATL